MAELIHKWTARIIRGKKVEELGTVEAQTRGVATGGARAAAEQAAYYWFPGHKHPYGLGTMDRRFCRAEQVLVAWRALVGRPGGAYQG
jgi:hypothetical protein